MDSPGFDFRHVQEFFLTPRLVLVPIRPSTHWARGSLLPGGKLVGIVYKQTLINEKLQFGKRGHLHERSPLKKRRSALYCSANRRRRKRRRRPLELETERSSSNHPKVKNQWSSNSVLHVCLFGLH